MLRFTILERHTVTLESDHTGTYPILVVRDGDVTVARIELHPNQAHQVWRMLKTATDYLDNGGNLRDK